MGRLQPVSRPGSSWFIHALVVLFSLLSAPAVGQAVEHGHQQDRQQDISEDNIKRHLTYSADCEININSLEYFDFTGDGIDEAVVVASTCATGTAGPDIHAVFTRQPDGTLAELKIHAPTENLGDLLGRVFYDLNVKDGLPKGFVRIRHFGFLAHRRRATFKATAKLGEFLDARFSQSF
jgi:hypothetical protein